MIIKSFEFYKFCKEQIGGARKLKVSDLFLYLTDCHHYVLSSQLGSKRSLSAKQAKKAKIYSKLLKQKVAGMKNQYLQCFQHLGDEEFRTLLGITVAEDVRKKDKRANQRIKISRNGKLYHVNR